MKKYRSKWILLAICGALGDVGLPAHAAPLKRDDVAASASWVVHVDCDGLRPTGVGQYLLAEMEKPESQSKLAAFQTIFGFDLRKQLHGLTLYNTGGRAEDGVLLVYADFDPDRLVTLAKAAKDYQGTNYNQHVIHSWIDDKKKGKHGLQPRTYAAIQGPRVIFSKQESSVAQALAVLDGATANLAATSEFPQLGAAGDASIVEGAARKLALSNSDPNAAIFRMSKRVLLQMGETNAQITATLGLEANDSETAGQIASIAQGLVALMKLQHDKPESLKLAQALTLKHDGATATATLALPESDLIDALKAGAARKAARKPRDAASAEDDK